MHIFGFYLNFVFLYVIINLSEFLEVFMSSDNKDKKNIEVVTGNGDELSISPVYSHLPISKPKIEKKSDKKIVIPKEKPKK